MKQSQWNGSEYTWKLFNKFICSNIHQNAFVYALNSKNKIILWLKRNYDGWSNARIAWPKHPFESIECNCNRHCGTERAILKGIFKLLLIRFGAFHIKPLLFYVLTFSPQPNWMALHIVEWVALYLMGAIFLNSILMYYLI